jgi:hypothetical protein
MTDLIARVTHALDPAADWAAYAKLLSDGTAADEPRLIHVLEALRLSPHDLKLHTLVISEAARLEREAADAADADAELAAAESEYDALRRERTEWLRLSNERLTNAQWRRQRAHGRRSVADTAARQLGAVRAVFRQLFADAPPASADAESWLPASLKNALHEMKTGAKPA